MSGKAKRTFARRLGRWLLGFGALILGLALAAVAIVELGFADRWARNAIIAQLGKMTGGRVELPKFHFEPFRLRAEMWDLTIHGHESAGAPPFFHADYLLVDIRVDSFFRRKISLNEVRVDRPQVVVRVAADGSSNVPAPKTSSPSSRPLRERIFDLVIRQVRLNKGEVVYNDARIPLAADGGRFDFALDYHSPAATPPFYLGQLSWQHIKLTAKRYLPFPSDVAAKFTLARDHFELNQLRWHIPHSEFDVEGALGSFAKPSWTFRYRGQLNLEDIRTILRKPRTPAGGVEFSGEGAYAAQNLTLRGRYSATGIAMRYEWFHAAGIATRGSYTANQSMLDVPDLEAHVLGGTLEGRLHLDFHGVRFRVDSRARGLDLARVLAAVSHEGFPINTLHWGGTVGVDSVSTWTADFKHLDSRGISLWEPALGPAAGQIPATAHLDYHYSADHRNVELARSKISTPASEVEFSGMLGADDSDLDVSFSTRDLLAWDDFINGIRGKDAEPQIITGRAEWRGRVLGPLDGPEFNGHVRGFQARYGRFRWDEIEGDMIYAPQSFRLAHARVSHGNSTALLDLQLQLSEWSFGPESHWTLDAGVDRADAHDLEEIFEWSYPVSGSLSGDFHGRGTHEEPELTGLFDLTAGQAWGYPVERFRGRLTLNHQDVRILDAELRATAGSSAQPRNGGRVEPPGLITGNLRYSFVDRQVEFDLNGAGIRVGNFAAIQTAKLPLGGELSFEWKGKGPLLAIVSEASFRLVDFRAGGDVVGSFEGQINSDGRRVHLDLRSAMTAGRLDGKVDLTLGGDYPITGDVSIEGLDVNPFLIAALHLNALTGRSSVDGHLQLRGALAKPDSIELDADLSHASFGYESVRLENNGPVRLRYRRSEVRIEQANLRGPDTDFAISGFARFSGDRQLGLILAGTLNARLAGGLVVGLDARGITRVNASIEGTMASPRITGRAHLDKVSATYDDFPAGLSELTGDFVFDASRMVFENVTAQTGGGVLTIGGTVTYGSGTFRYDLSARADRVRIRYPEGMSWLAGGTLRLSGTREAGLLSGRIVLERLFLAQGFDLASMIIASKEPVRAPSTSSSYLRNLQFDIEGVSGSGSRVEWAGANFESEASLRVRGTWEHPVLLGNVRLLNGEMTFRGNRYRLSRGDLNFSNPFRLDPVLNVEATTTIRQYEVTLNFSGPASKLILSYRSDPPLPSNDIIALLALGSTSESSELRTSGAGANSQLGANTLLSEAISSQLGGRIERLFGISRFRVDPFLGGSVAGQNAPARVTIEQQVTRDLVITYITNVTSTQQQVIQVEYNVSRDISIVGLRDENGTFSLDVKFKKRFK